jgi:hypothetical protein
VTRARPADPFKYKARTDPDAPLPHLVGRLRIGSMQGLAARRYARRRFRKAAHAFLNRAR